MVILLLFTLSAFPQNFAWAGGPSQAPSATVCEENLAPQRTLQEVIHRHAVREANNVALVQTGIGLLAKGYRWLNVNDPEERALLRLLTMHPTSSREQAREFEWVFTSIPASARTVLINELNIDEAAYEWGTLIDSAISALGPERSVDALESALLAMAKAFQAARNETASYAGAGIPTFNVEKLVAYMQSEEFKARPKSILDFDYGLFVTIEEAKAAIPYSMGDRPHGPEGCRRK